jgi:chromosome segregation ATPase
MPWLYRSPDLKNMVCQVSLSLLYSLDISLAVGLQPYQAALQSGKNPESVFEELGQFLAEQRKQQKDRIEGLESRLSQCERRLAWLDQENERLRKEPVREQMLQAQTKVQALSQDLRRAEDELSATYQAFEVEQLAHHQEATQREDYIAALNRIIAQQQLRLNSLMGETPEPESTGKG